MPSDPTDVRSIAVTTGDVVAALELNRTSDDHATLRITPPFSARMRARLHVSRTGDGNHRADAPGDSGVSGYTHGGAPDENRSQGESRDHAGGDQTRDGPLYIDPEQLVADPPAYPRPTETRAALLEDPETTYTVERHHEHHATAIQEWRESIPGCIRGQITLDTADGKRELTVRTLQDDLL